MEDVNVLSTEDRVAIDRVFERLNGGTHYEILTVPADSSWEVVERAVCDIRKRLEVTRFVGVPTVEYQRRIDHIFRALDQATEVLSDPVRRFLYDQQLRRGDGRRGETPSPVRPALTPIPPRPSTRPAPDARGPRPTEVTPAFDPSDSAPLVVPAPLRKEPVVPSAGVRAPSSRPPFVPPPIDAYARSASRRTTLAATSSSQAADRRDVDALVAEVERIAVSVQYCIAQILEPQADRASALQNAGQALAETRATLAALQARRDEEAGRWPEATANWLRASRAKPQDASLLARVASCHHHLGDHQAAEDSARRALVVDPGSEAARAVLAALSRR